MFVTGRRQGIRTVVFSALGLIVIFSGCVRRNEAARGASTRNGDNTFVNVSSCGRTLTATMQRISDAVVDLDVFFKIEVSGGSGSYKLLGEDKYFTQQYIFPKRFSSAGLVTQQVVVEDVNCEDVQANLSLTFEVVPQGTTLACAVTPDKLAALFPANGGHVTFNFTVVNFPATANSRLIAFGDFSNGLYDEAAVEAQLPTATGSAHSLSVKFQEPGVKLAVFEIEDSVDDEKHAICAAVVTVIAQTPTNPGNIELSEGPVLDFGEKKAGSAAPVRSVQLTNVGSTNARIESITLSSGVGDFTVSNGTCSINQDLAPGAHCQVSVTALTSAGPDPDREGVLTVGFRPTGGSSRQVSRSLEVTIRNGANLVLSPLAPVDFGKIEIGQQSAAQTLTASNSGDLPASLQAPSLSPNQNFVITGGSCTAGATVAAGASCTILVKAEPREAGDLSSTVTLAYSDSFGAGTPAQRIVEVEGLRTGPRLSTGYLHSCAVTDDGDARCWGYNAYGQLGNGNNTGSNRPEQVSGLENNVVSIAAGCHHTCAIRQNGSLVCWGYNYWGQLGDGTSTSRNAPALVSGMNSGVTQVATGCHTTCAIKNKALYCWGYNGYGQLGDGTATARYAPVQVSGMDGIYKKAVEVSVAQDPYSAADHACVKLENGAAYCWGYNGYGQLGDGTTTNRYAPYLQTAFDQDTHQIVALRLRTCGIRGGSLKCQGYNGNGELGDGTATTRYVATQVSGLTSGVTAVGGGVIHTCAIVSGALKCWGYNAYGQVGDGSATNRYTPSNVYPPFGSLVDEIAVGGWLHTCARRDGEAYCWGYNAHGQLGDGNYTTRYVPALVNRL